MDALSHVLNVIDMPITIEQIKELMEKATKGEWACSVKGEVTCVSTKLTPSSWMKIAESSVDNATFIAALPSIAQLCLDQAEEIERLNLIIRGKTFSE